MMRKAAHPASSRLSVQSSLTSRRNRVSAWGTRELDFWLRGLQSRLPGMAIKPLNMLAALAVLSVPLGEAAAGGRPVKCYQRVFQPPLYDTVRERVQIQGAWIRLETNPAIYDIRPVRRLVSPEHVIWRVIPAEYGTVREKVQPRVARTVPAVTRTVYRKERVDGG